MWAVTGAALSRRDYMVVAGLLLGLGAWTRVEGILYALAISGAVGLVLLLQRRAVWPAVWLVAPVAVIGGIWLIFYRTYGLANSQAGNALFAALAGWKSGDLRLHSIRLILGYLRRELLDIHTWGLLFPLAAAFLLLGLRKLRDGTAAALALATVACGLVTAGLFYVGAYDRGDLVGWLTRGFPRAFFPAAILLAILSFVLAGANPRWATEESVPPS
jgi:hypothetical protein